MLLMMLMNCFSEMIHYIKSELIWPAFFRIWTGIQSECGKMRTKITPTMGTFSANVATIKSPLSLITSQDRCHSEFPDFKIYN